MPNTIIHEEVGLYLSKKLNRSSYEYYLGLMAPDAVNCDGFASKSDRWNAHLRCDDLDEWKNNVKKFYKNEQEKYNNDFLLGYCIHIITDIVYDKYFDENIKNEILKDNDERDFWYIKWSDMDKYYFDGADDIKNILKSCDKLYEIRNIDTKNLKKWKNRFLKNSTNINKSIYFKPKIIDNLSIIVEEELRDML